MSQDQPYDQIGGPPAAPTPRRGVPRVAVVVGLTTFLGLAGAGVAFAVGGGGAAPASLSASSSTSSTSNPKGPDGHPGMRMGPAAGLGGLGGPGGAVVHGIYTIKSGSSYKTVAEQVGQVTAVSTTSLTVKSTDGFVQVYVVQSSTVVDSQAGGISSVANGDTVRVEALVAGETQTATNIIDTTKIGASRQGFGFGAGHPKGGPGEAPASPSTPSSSTPPTSAA